MTLKNTADTLVLRNGESELVLCPAIGASIARYNWRGHPILRSAPDAEIRDGNVRGMGSYPLLPYSNRVGHCKLVIDNATHLLRPNFLPEPHAVHGFAWQRAWNVESHDEHRAQLSLQHQPDGDWPFACDGEQMTVLTPDSVTITLRVINRDARPMPAGLGFHPYFPRDEKLTLKTQWTGMWSMDRESLPVAHVAPSGDFSQARAVAGWRVDHCFTGWNRTAVLDYQTHIVKISASEACDHVICYIPADGRPFIAIEPVSHANNALQLIARGVENTGMRWLEPGESFQIDMTISVEQGNTYA
jgi:aldose 1-epimerase